MLRAKHLVTIEVDAPVDSRPDDLIDELIGEGLHACANYDDQPELAAKLAVIRGLGIDASRVVKIDGSEYDGDPGCVVDWDCACYYGDGDDGVYFDACKGCDGKWYCSATVDCNSGSWCDALFENAGPFNCAEGALHFALNSAAEWCALNGVTDCDDYQAAYEYVKERAEVLEVLT